MSAWGTARARSLAPLVEVVPKVDIKHTPPRDPIATELFGSRRCRVITSPARISVPRKLHRSGRATPRNSHTLVRLVRPERRRSKTKSPPAHSRAQAPKDTSAAEGFTRALTFRVLTRFARGSFARSFPSFSPRRERARTHVRSGAHRACSTSASVSVLLLARRSIWIDTFLPLFGEKKTVGISQRDP